MNKLIFSIFALLSTAGTAHAQAGGNPSGGAGPDPRIPVTFVCTRTATVGSPAEVTREFFSHEGICKFEYGYYAKGGGSNENAPPVGGTWSTYISIPAGQQYGAATINFPADPAKYTVRVLYGYPMELSDVSKSDNGFNLKNGTCKQVHSDFGQFSTPGGNQFAGSAYKFACDRFYFEGK